MNPRVSIVIPVYNGSNYVREAIDCALAQTYPNLEVIVVDDGSQDGGKTAAILKSYGDRIRPLFLQHGGIVATLNAGIRAMTGEVFSWLSHDDRYFPNKIQRQMETLHKNGGKVIVYSDYELIDPRGRRLKQRILPHFPADQFRYRMLFDHSINGCSLLIPRQCFETGMFDERWPTTQDYQLWFRLAEHYRFVHVPEVLLQYRIHPQQESWTNPRHLAECNTLLVHFLEALPPRTILDLVQQPLSLVYAKIAFRLKLRGFQQAAQHALNLSGQHLQTPGQRWSLHRLALLAAYRIADPRLRPMHWWRRFTFQAVPTASNP